MAKAIKGAIAAALVVFAIVSLPFVSIGSAISVFGWGAAASMAAITFATTLISSGLAMLTSKGLEANNGNFGTKVTTRNAQAPRQLVYGKSLVGGTIVHMQTNGTDNHKLNMVAVIAGHEIQELEAIRINGNNVVLGTNTSTSTIGGKTVHTVTSSTFTNGDNDNSYTGGRLIRFSVNTGNQTTADGFLRNQLGGSIPTTHIYKDCAYVYMQCIYDPEKLAQPPTVAFLVKGKKCYDPRSGSTAWTDNPALIIRDFISNNTYGLKAENAEINDTTGAGGFSSAANTCDQSVSSGSGGATEKRYTANGFTNFSAAPDGILEGLIAACAGKVTYVNGKFNLFVGAAQTPSLTITDDKLLTAPQISTKPNNGEIYNTVKSIYVDASNNYIGTDGPIIQDTTFLNEDTPSGESTANYVKQLEVQMPYTTTVTMADRLSKIALRHGRKTVTLSCTTTLEFMKLQPCDWVYVTNERLGFTNKVFEVISTNLEIVGEDAPTAATKLELKEIDSAVFNHAVNEYSVIPDEGSDISDTDRTPSPPTNVSATTISYSSYVVNIKLLRIAWTNSVSELVVSSEVSYKISTDSEYQILPPVAKGVAFAFAPNAEVGKTYDVRVRHLNVHGVYSTYAVAQSTVSGTAQSSTDLQNDAITVDSTTGQIGGIGTGNGSRIFNDIIDIDLDTVTNIGRISIGGIGGTNNVIDVTKTNLALDYFDGATKTEFDTLANTDGSIGIKNNNASSFTNLSPFTAEELLKLTNLRAGTAPDDANVSIKNDGITVDTTTGQIGGIGTGNNSRIYNDIIEIGLATSGSNIGRVTIDGIGGTNNTIDVTKSNLNLDYFDGANKTEFDSVSGTDGKIGIKNNNATNYTLLEPFTSAELTKLVNLRAGTAPDDASVSIKNDGITINSTTGVIGGIGTGSGSRVFNDVIGIALDTTTNVGRISISGIGTSNTTVDVTKGNLGLNYADGATVGATLGTDLVDSGGTALGDEDVKNDDLSLAFSGTNIQIKKGTTQIGSDVDAPSALKNAEIVSSDVVGATGKLFTSLPASGATVGANWNTDINNQPADDDITNTRITTKADGTLNYDGTTAAAPSLSSIGGVVGLASGGFGGNVSTLFGSTAGLIPRWNGSGFENLAEIGLLNDQISINADGEIAGIGTGDGTFVNNSLVGNDRTLTINASSSAYNSARGLPNGTDSTGKAYLIGTTGLPTYGGLTYDTGHKVAPSAFFIESVQSGGYNKITLKNFQFGVTGGLTFTASGKGSTGGTLLLYLSAGISSSASSYNQVTNGDLGEVLVLSQFSTAATFSSGFSVLVNEVELSILQASESITGHLWLWAELYVSSVTAVSSAPKIQLVDRTDSQIILGRTTGAAQTGNYSHSTSTASIARS